MAVCVTAIILLIPHFFGKDNITAEISVDGKVVEEVSLSGLDRDYEYTTDTSPAVTVKAEKGRIRVADADCPDKLCVKCGWLDSDGDMAVCLPAKVVVSVKGASSADLPDVITY